MEECFKKFIDKISLSPKQREYAITKYKNVCKTLYKEFYGGEFQESSKFLFGSYKKKTTVFHSEKDVDVIFKIPKEEFEKYQNQENGPSNLLTKVKNTLKDTYPTTDKIKNWTKVVSVDFQTFKVEVLPALENDDGTFTIPNNGEGADWENFNPKKEIDKFYNSNKSTSNLTRDLIKIIKKWKIDKTTVDIKSYKIDEYVINFLKNYIFENYPKLLKDFFDYLKIFINETFINSAITNSTKALEFYEKDDLENAILEYKKLFGDLFPSKIKKSFYNTDYIQAPNEEFIKDYHKVDLNNDFFVKIDCIIDQNGWRPQFLSSIKFLSKNKKLKFFIKNHNIPFPFSVKWKVRNFGKEAEDKNDLRGEITDDKGLKEKKENSRYNGEHFVECYIIKDGVCVAIDKVIVPISNI